MPTPTPKESKNISDCEQDGCGNCDVCKYLEFKDWASSVAPAESTIERNEELEDYLKLHYDQGRIKRTAKNKRFK